MSNEWAHDAVRKEVPTVINITLDGCAVATSAARAAAVVAGTCPRGVVSAQLVQDGSGFAAAGTTMPVGLVVARPRMQLQKYPFMTHGAVINGAKLGPHRAWDPV
jgi:hypothetical protein